MAMYHPSYLRRAREICTQYEVHLIADEIAVGFGRTGTMFACEQADIKPDFMCLSKGITGGYIALSAVLTTEKVYQAFYDDSALKGFLHSHSYTGNPLACSAALATLAIFDTDQVIAKNKQKAAYLASQASVFNDLPIKHLRQQGMILAFDVQSKQTKFASACYTAALSQGLLLRPIGNTVYFMPPYTTTESEIDFMIEATLGALRQLL